MGYSYIFYENHCWIGILSFKDKDVEEFRTELQTELRVEKYKIKTYFGAKTEGAFYFTEKDYFKTLSKVYHVLIKKTFEILKI